MIERTHIGIFGPRNAGKSSLVNLLTSQEVSIVSNVAGTTTDPVSKPIEINGLGACVFIDTAGYDDYGALGEMRVTKTKEVLKRCDIAIFLIPSTIFEEKEKLQEATKWFTLIKERSKTLLVVNHFADVKNETEHKKCDVEKLFGVSEYIEINIAQKQGRDEVLKAIGFVQSQYQQEISIVTHLVKPTETVVLVMPQDIQAPKGRLILPQVQTIRELLDYGCTTICTTTAKLAQTLNSLKNAPALIVTDSQDFRTVYELKPEETKLTSFSVLFARWKGDIDEFIRGAEALSSLNANSKVLIAEACTHAPLAEDIGREKIPALIHKKIDPNIKFDIISGHDWNVDFSKYDLIIHCGACMFNRTQMLNRINDVKKHKIKITNYGITIAYLNGIIHKITW
ncbi:MAG: [FeFe] hydrogenase H-cluster maturation GTPase HydF [Paludibacteraceae bacterium]|nr:[FeFe] hydrogenase H-cluster maturation GTPase HydF [Paludibacteraceae bacterium]